MQERLIGDEVRRRDDDPLVRSVDQGDEEALVVLRRLAGAARQRLGGVGSGALRVGEDVRAVEHLLCLHEPVGGEDVLQLQHRRAGDAGHQLVVRDPLGVASIDNVLRAGVADPAVDHRDLAMIAQVDAGRAPAQEAPEAHRQ